MDVPIKKRSNIYVYILAAIFCSILFILKPMKAYAAYPSVYFANKGGTFSGGSTKDGYHEGYIHYYDSYIITTSRPTPRPNSGLTFLGYSQDVAFNTTNPNAWAAVGYYRAGISTTVSWDCYFANYPYYSDGYFADRPKNVEEYKATMNTGTGIITVARKNGYVYSTKHVNSCINSGSGSMSDYFAVYAKNMHTHNSSGVEYGQYNGTYHYKYTFCNGHGGNHSQNRSSSTEGHSFGGWSDWTDYNAEQQVQSQTCSKCGYVAYNYQPRPYIIYYNGNNGSISYTSNTINYGATLGTLPTGSRVGYIFNGFFTAPSGGSQVSSGTTVTGTATYYAHWTPRTDTKYTVRHYQMNVNGSGYTLTDTDNLQGTTDTSVTPATKSYTGFTAPSKQTVNIDGNGSRVVDYYYTRNKYTFTLGTDASHYSHGIDTSGTSANGSYYYGATIALKASPKAGYSWSKWSDDNTSLSRTVTMPANNLTIIPYATLITYTIKYNTYGGSVSGNPTSYNVETATITLKNPALSGRTFKGWSSWNNSTRKTTFTIPKGSTGNLVISANWESNSSDPIYVGESEIKSNRFAIKI